jgi:UDP-2,3-diacylglucosamine pyrophosphatase LpxH
MAGIKERLSQVVLRGKDLLSGEAGKSAVALDSLRVTGEALQASLGQTEGAAKLARQLDQTRVTTERAQVAYGKAQEEVARLREEMAAAPRGQLEASLKSAEQNARKAASEVRGLRKELTARPDDTGVARDLEQAERLAGEARAEVLALLMRRCREGMRIVYIPGNHDDELRAFAGAELGNIEIKREAVHTTRCGRKLLVIHGDEFDAVVRGRSLGVVLGAFACRRLLTLNRFVHWLADVFGRRYWSLAQHVKARIPAAKGYVARFEEAVLDAARKAGADGVVCGHIHKADLREQDGLVYCNDGDWVESCTALVESHAGELSLLRWRPSASSVAASAAAPERILGSASI